MTHSVLKQARIPLHGYFPYQKRRKFHPTMSALLINNGKVLFVQSAKDPKGETWLLPQGGIKIESICAAMLREVNEELRIPRAGIDISTAKVLGQYINKIPKERACKKDKLIIVIGAHLVVREIVLNSENMKYKFISNEWELMALMGGMRECRPIKFVATFEALIVAYQLGMIPWSCENVLHEVSKAV